MRSMMAILVGFLPWAAEVCGDEKMRQIGQQHAASVIPLHLSRVAVRRSDHNLDLERRSRKPAARSGSPRCEELSPLWSPDRQNRFLGLPVPAARAQRAAT